MSEYSFSQDLINDIRPSANVTKSLRFEFAEESLGVPSDLLYPGSLVVRGPGFGLEAFGEEPFGLGGILEGEVTEIEDFHYII